MRAIEKPTKTLLVFIFLAILLVAAFGFYFYKNSAQIARAGVGSNVFGYAWSETIGWLSFNNTNTGGPTDYGVSLDASTLEFSGYAWSEHIGWVSFNPAELTGCPQGNCKATLDIVNKKVNGWARVLSPVGDPQGGGWDGWIRLSGTTTNSLPYGVTWNPWTREFEGYAWGSDVMGWLSFNCKNNSVCGASNYQVRSTINFPPTAINLTVNAGDYCSAPLRPRYSWTFTDPDPPDTQGSYQVQIDTEPSFSPPLIDDSTKINSNSNTYSSLNALPGYRATYYWQLKVWDNFGSSSVNWAAGPSFTTPNHAYPNPQFTWFPTLPGRGEFVDFDSTASKCYDNSDQLISCASKTFRWTFPSDAVFGTSSSATSSNPVAKFTTTGAKIVYLSISDEVGACTTSHAFNAIVLPKWREFSPR